MDVGRSRSEPRSARPLIVATGVGFTLRLGWAVWATQGAPGRISDPARYQQIAQGFAHGRTMSMGSTASAFWSPGYPMALTPLAWVAEHTGAISLPFAASLLNVVAGTATIVLVALLASMWIGRPARTVAAWLMAVAPGPIYLTTVAMSETWFVMLTLLVLVLVTVAVDRGWSRRRFGAIGLVAGYAVLVRSPGAMLLVVPLLVAAARPGSWRSGLRQMLAMLAGAVVVLAPWTVRNGIEVGIWTPTSTNNVAFLCTGNGPGANGAADTSVATGRRCYRHSPYDDRTLYTPGEAPADFDFTSPDEPRWYRATARDTAAWMVRHPQAQPRLVAHRMYETFKGEHEALSDAEGFGDQPLMGPRVRRVLGRAGDLWLWGVSALGALALWFVDRCRRAVPIWGLAALQVLMVTPGVGTERLHQPVSPLLVVLAAGAVARLRRDAPRVADDDRATATVDATADRRLPVGTST